MASLKAEDQYMFMQKKQSQNERKKSSCDKQNIRMKKKFSFMDTIFKNVLMRILVIFTGSEELLYSLA